MINRKNLIIILILLLIPLLIFLFKNNIGDVRPALFPVKQTEEKQITTTSFKKDLFASDLGNARDLEFSPDQTLLVSIPASGKVLALVDKDQDNRAEKIKEVLSNLDKPHGISFFDNKLYIAEETQVSRYLWDEQNLDASLDKKLFSLPKGGRHVTRSIDFDKDGKMYVSIGSSCDVCIEAHPFLAAIIVASKDGENPTVFAKGLRNAVFITINPETNQLWGTEMGRDFLGDDLPPDEINIIKEGGDYGWPYCYGDKVRDLKFGGDVSCDKIELPFYKICAHCAPLGLTFINSAKFPENWQGDLLVSYHGSWNSSIPAGYKIVRLDLEGDKIIKEEDFITGFLEGSQVSGRPVDLIFDTNGDLYFSDDKLGAVYKVTYR